MLHQELWTSFNDIYFKEDTHSYTDSLGTRYSSATGWVKKFCPESDFRKIAFYSAKKKYKDDVENMPKDQAFKFLNEKATEIQMEWNKSGLYSRTLGTQVHSVMENLWYKKDYKGDKAIMDMTDKDMYADFLVRKEKCKKIFDKLKTQYLPIANEFIVYDQPNGLCGTIDFLAYNYVKNQFEILDWKTSKEFSTESKNRDNPFCTAPFEDMPNCNTTEYSLQLSLYKYMLEKKTSIKISRLVLIQIPKGDEKPIPYVCTDLSDRIAKLLEK